MSSESPSFIPQRLTEARIAASKTMRSLASECELSATSISAYESGTRTPTSDTLTRLADALGVPFQYFIGERPFRVQAKGAVFFRSQVSARTRREHEKRRQLANWTFEVSAWIDQFVALPEPNLPDFPTTEDILEEADIEEAAVRLRSFWGLTQGPIRDLITLLENQGIFVVRQPSGSKKLDAFSRIINGRPIVFLGSEKSSLVRSRFDAAHELGHLILHQHLTQSELAEKETLKRVEREANMFAGSFLMPEESFAQDLQGLTLSCFITLKRRWLTSIQSMIHRCQQLGVLDYDHYKSLQIQISSRGWRTREPLDVELPIELPKIPRRAWELISANEKLGTRSIIDELRLPTSFVSSVLGVPEESLIPQSASNKIIPIDLATRSAMRKQ